MPVYVINSKEDSKHYFVKVEAGKGVVAAAANLRNDELVAHGELTFEEGHNSISLQDYSVFPRHFDPKEALENYKKLYRYDSEWVSGMLNNFMEIEQLGVDKAEAALVVEQLDDRQREFFKTLVAARKEVIENCKWTLKQLVLSINS